MRSLGVLGCLLVAACGFGDNNPHVVDSPPPPPDVPSGDELIVLSEYVEGTSNNKAIELHNEGTTTLDLAAGTCEVRVYFNGDTDPFRFALTGTLDPDAVLVLCHSSADAALLPHCDLLTDVMNWNGDDGVEIACHGATLDVLGQVGVDPGTAWSNELGTATTLDTTLRRLCSVKEGDHDPTNPFALETWAALPLDTFDDLGLPTCAQ